MNPFNPAFAARVHAKRRLVAGGGVAGGPGEAHAETHGEAHVPVHVAFARAVAGPLRREAEARDASPQVLAAALVAAAIERGMVDELLAGRAPERLCGGQGRRADGLTLFQCAVIYLVGHHADSRGVCRLLNRDFARLTGRVSGSWIGVALERLESRGFLQRCPPEGCLQPRRLTPLGRAVFDTLDGGILDGGEGAVGSGQWAVGSRGERAMNAAAPSGPVLSDAQRLAAIRAALDAIAPGQWSRAADGQGEFCETRGRKGELWKLARFDPGATSAEMEFCVGAPEMVRFLLGLVDRAVAASRRQWAVGSRQSGEERREAEAGVSSPPSSGGEVARRRRDGEGVDPSTSATPKNHAAEAAMLCASPAFMRFLHERHGLSFDGVHDEATRKARAAQRLRSVLGVGSRREINDGGAALAAWKELRRDFHVWKGRVVV